MSNMLFPPPKPEGACSGLHQGEWWVDVNRQWHKVDEMTLGHVENVMAMLRSRAAVLALIETWGMYGYAATAPDGAANAIELEIAEIEANPLAWLKSTTLYRALKKRRKKLRKAIDAREATQRLLLLPDISITAERNPGWTWTDEQ